MALSQATTAAQLVASLLATLGAFGVYKLVAAFINNTTSPLRRLPGPPSPSFIWGNLKDIWEAVRIPRRRLANEVAHGVPGELCAA